MAEPSYIIATDWVTIEREYRAGQLSIAAICAQYNVSRPALDRQAALHSWSRDLAQQVRTATREQIIRAAIPEDESNVDFVQRAAERGADVVLKHRDDIAKLRTLAERQLTVAQRLVENDYDPGDEEAMLRLRADRMSLSKSDGTAQLVSRVVGIYSELIDLERKAFDLDTPDQPMDEEDVRQKTAAIKAELKRRGIAIEDPRSRSTRILSINGDVRGQSRTEAPDPE